MYDTISTTIHVIIYFSFAGLLIHLIMKAHLIETVHNDINAFKTNLLAIENRITSLTSSINNKLMIDESKARTLEIDVKAEEKTIV